MFLFLAISSFLCVLFVRRLLSRNVLKQSLPPGPKPSRIPLIGNLLDIPSSFPWETFDKWYKESQSELTYLNVAGSHIVILNTYEAAIDLLHKRSTLYSSRVRSPMVLELIEFNNFGLFPHGDRWRCHRRLFHQAFNETEVKRFHSRLTRATSRLLLRLVEQPGNVLHNIEYVVGSMILSIAYGIETSSDNDPHLTHIERTVSVLTSTVVPGAFLVDFIPWLKYIPRWLPGTGFQHEAERLKAMVEDMRTEPYEAAKQRMEGNHDPSFVVKSLEKMDRDNATVHYDKNDLKDVAMTIFSSGAETTVAFLSVFMLAMVLHPEVQQKAQAEIDEVLKGSLPTLEDRNSLPYVNALVKEVLRWKPVAPLGLPHCLISDDVYQGYRIPAGSMVITNIWSMFQDEAVYPDPATFNPDRFLENGRLNSAVRDPETIAFGFGRRICPGRYMAASFIWMAAASILATFDITKAIDKDGNVIEPAIEFKSAIVSGPKPFRCNVNLRKSMRDTVTKIHNDLEMI